MRDYEPYLFHCCSGAVCAERTLRQHVVCRRRQLQRGLRRLRDRVHRGWVRRYDDKQGVRHHPGSHKLQRMQGRRHDQGHAGHIRQGVLHRDNQQQRMPFARICKQESLYRGCRLERGNAHCRKVDADERGRQRNVPHRHKRHSLRARKGRRHWCVPNWFYLEGWCDARDLDYCRRLLRRRGFSRQCE